MHRSLRGSQNCITCLTTDGTKRRRAARGRFLARLLTLALVLILVLSGLTACGGDSSGGSGGSGSGSNGSGSSSEESAGFKTPEFKGAKFHEDEAIDAGSVKLDVSHVARGYVAVSAYSDSRLKFQVFKGEEVYTYDLDNDGDPTVFPLTLGSGSYTFKVMENITDNKYTELYSYDCEVDLKSKFEPFLRPSCYVNYSKDSDCVKKANELAKGCASEAEVVEAIYDFVAKNIDYDKEKAANTTTIVPPDPDETMNTGKGICFDYASLTASMLRSQGIPCKVIFGYVSPDDLYHAWNMFYTEETGWVTVEFSAEPNEWNRLDLTFTAGGTNEEFIGDGTNYNDVYAY